jgi:cytochrome c556
MSRTARLLALGTTMCLALLLTLGDAKARYFADAPFQKDLDALVELLKSDKPDQAKVKAAVAAIQKKNDDLNDLMAIYKPTKSKGLGWNPAKKGPGDGIEKRIIDLGTKKELTKAELAKEKEHIVRAAYYNLAMYEITKGFGPPKKTGKGVKEWSKHNAEVKEGSEEALAAVKANDPAALKKAMARIGGGCNECHSDFRN